MTNENYDWDAFINISILKQSQKKQDQQRLVQLLNSFATDNGWKLCSGFLLRDERFRELLNQDLDLSEKDFFCFRAIEDYLKKSYKIDHSTDSAFNMRYFIITYLEKTILNQNNLCESYIRNKCIHILTQIGMIDYPSKWPNFFKDLLTVLNNLNAANHLNEIAIEFFLNFLIDWNLEACSRGVEDTNIDLSTSIKDWMRDNDLNSLMEVINYVIITIGNNKPKLLKKALKAASLFISWIDINYLINDTILDGIISALTLSTDNYVKSACLNCLSNIIKKGMSDSHKIELIIYIDNKLNQNNLWNKLIEESKLITENLDNDLIDLDEDELQKCYYITLGTLNDDIGIHLVECWKNLSKQTTELDGVNKLNVMVVNRMKYALSFLSCPNNTISETNFQSVQNYLCILKTNYNANTTKKTRKLNGTTVIINKSNVSTMSDIEKQILQELVNVIYLKLQYPSWYEYQNEEEAEEEFLEYRKQLLVILTHLIQLNEDFVCEHIKNIINYIYEKQYQLSAVEIEAGLTIFYHIGEAIRSIKSDFFRSDCSVNVIMKSCMKTLCESSFGRHENVQIRIMFFEIIFRYERFFNYNSEYILDILSIFLSEHGLKSSQLKLVTRCVYILSKLIKLHKNNLGEASIRILQEISVILQTSFINNALFCTDLTSSVSAYSYLYESASQLLLSISIDNKPHMFQSLIQPILLKLPNMLQEWSMAVDESLTNNQATKNNVLKLACGINAAGTYINHTLRAFNGTYTLSQMGCLDIYINSLDIFIKNVQIGFAQCKSPVPIGRQKITCSVRSLLRIMCKIAKNDDLAIESILQRLPLCIEIFSRNLSIDEMGFIPLCIELNEILPLYMQIINAFQGKCLDFLRNSLYSIVNMNQKVIYTSFSIDFNCTEQFSKEDVVEQTKDLIRLNFQLLKSNLKLIIQSQNTMNFAEIFSRSIDIISQYNFDKLDYTALRLFISVYHEFIKLIPELDAELVEKIITEVVYESFLPLIIVLPINPLFDPSDANSHFVMEDICNFQIKINETLPNFANFPLKQILSKLNLPEESIHEYLRQLTANKPDFIGFAKKFYQQNRHQKY